MVERAKAQAKLDKSHKIKSLGLCLSGLITDNECETFANELLDFLPQISENCMAANDTVGSVYTTNLKGESVGPIYIYSFLVKKRTIQANIRSTSAQ